MNLPLQQYSEIVTAMRALEGATLPNERRGASRMAVCVRVQIHLLERGQIKKSFSALARDISLAGMGTIQAIALPEGSELLIELPKHGGVIGVCAVVAKCIAIADGLLAVGSQFTSMADPALVASLGKLQSDESARIQRSMMA